MRLPKTVKQLYFKIRYPLTVKASCPFCGTVFTIKRCDRGTAKEVHCKSCGRDLIT